MSIYVLAADGSSQREVVKGDNVNFGPVWTADGSHILFVSDRSRTFGLYSIGVQQGNAVGVPSPVKGASISDRIQPIGMTAADSYYYVKDSGGTDVFQSAIGPDGKLRGVPRRVSDNGVGYNHSPSWSPDGMQIAFKRERPGIRNSFDLVIHDVQTRNEKTYSKEGMNNVAPVWTRDGRRLLVRASREMYELDLMTEVFTPITGAPAGSVDVGPDDNILYFTTASGIVSFNTAAKEQRAVWTAPRLALPAGAPQSEFRPPLSSSLSPDGRTLAITRQVSGLARVGVDGTGYMELERDAHSWGVTWTPDGRGILYVNSDYKVMRIPSTGGTPLFTGLSLNRIESFGLRPPGGSQVIFSDVAPAEIWKLDNVSSSLKDGL
jgi:hypothetical protein